MIIVSAAKIMGCPFGFAPEGDAAPGFPVARSQLALQPDPVGR